MPENPTDNYLTTTSDRFQQVFSDVETLVRKTFPTAQPVFDYDMPGWKIPLEGPERPATGTIDPNAIYIMLVERNAGITLHTMNPLDYYYLDDYKEELSQAGFKVMRGCLQFSKKSDYPLEAVATLLQSLKTHIAAEAEKHV